MILISNKEILAIQNNFKPKYKNFLDKKASGDIMVNDYDLILKHFEKLFSKVLIGEIRYFDYVYFANKVIENEKSLKFFTESRKKSEILEHLRKL